MSGAVTLPRRITVVGLGYVGLPLAARFAEHLPVTGYDIDRDRLAALRGGVDRNREMTREEILRPGLDFTDDPGCLADAEFIIVTMPTPVDHENVPDLTPLVSASETIGRQLARRKPGLPPPVIVYESTTFPGCTEEVCAPVIEEASGLKSGKGFKLGYSPERINFGDREHTLATVIKVVAGQDMPTTDIVEAVYRLVARAGTHRTPDIRTAEAAKVIENIQRDLNIALMNELAIVFDRLGIKTSDVLAAAGTKWNFIPFRPGLVGGHCIPVDPYYLTHRSICAGYHPQVILAGRAVNEQMPNFIAEKTAELLSQTGKNVRGARVLVLGVTFKPDITDLRNTKVVRLVRHMIRHGAHVETYDPVVGSVEVAGLGLTASSDPFKAAPYDAAVLASPHREFLAQGPGRLFNLIARPGVFVDVAGAIPAAGINVQGVKYWRP